MDLRRPGLPHAVPSDLRPACPVASGHARWRWLAPLALLVAVGASGCRHAPPVRPWQRGNLVQRSLQFDDGLEGRFRQHMFGAREGAEGGYGHVGGGCGCN